MSRVQMAELSERTIRRYIDSGEPYGKAGAYAVQGRIAAWIERIEGSYSPIGAPKPSPTRSSRLTRSIRA